VNVVFDQFAEAEVSVGNLLLDLKGEHLVNILHHS
jgi:hypothetical protein